MQIAAMLTIPSALGARLELSPILATLLRMPKDYHQLSSNAPILVLKRKKRSQS